MGVIANSGRIRITNADGDLRLDTDDGLFHIVGDAITGSRSYANQSTGASRRNDTITQVIGTCHPDCTHVIGAAKFTGTPGPIAPIGYDRWVTYLGGTLIWSLHGPALVSGLLGGVYRHNITQACTYRFYVESGNVMFEKRLVMEATRQATATLVAHGIQWNLKTGLFT